MTRYLRIAASTLVARHDCTIAGIVARCGGRCCYGPTYWPARSSAEGAAGGPCANLGPTGCTWDPADRPATCLLYPLRLTSTGRGLVLHHRTRFAKGICAGNYGTGPMLVDALRPGLEALFGAEAIAWAREEAIAGRDVLLEVGEDLAAALAREEELEAANLPPERRSLPVVQ